VLRAGEFWLNHELAVHRLTPNNAAHRRVGSAQHAVTAGAARNDICVNALKCEAICRVGAIVGPKFGCCMIAMSAFEPSRGWEKDKSHAQKTRRSICRGRVAWRGTAAFRLLHRARRWSGPEICGPGSEQHSSRSHQLPAMTDMRLGA
jgi:hypothetical protein